MCVCVCVCVCVWCFDFVWRGRGSNPRPPDYEANAVSTRPPNRSILTTTYSWAWERKWVQHLDGILGRVSDAILLVVVHWYESQWSRRCFRWSHTVASCSMVSSSPGPACTGVGGWGIVGTWNSIHLIRYCYRFRFKNLLYTQKVDVIIDMMLFC